MRATNRMVVVSNRLPVIIDQSSKGFKVGPSHGGLVTALRPLIKECAGVWIGWTGTDASPEIERVLEDIPGRAISRSSPSL